MRTPVGPVNAAAREDSPGGREAIEVDTQVGDQLLAAIGQNVVTVVNWGHCRDGKQPVAKLDAPSAGEVVIAGPRLGQSDSGAVLAKRPDLGARGDLSKRFENGRDLRAGELVVAVAALYPHSHQPTFDEPAQVRCGGHRVHSSAPGKLPRRQRLAISQRGQHRHPRGIADQRPHRTQVAVTSL